MQILSLNSARADHRPSGGTLSCKKVHEIAGYGIGYALHFPFYWRKGDVPKLWASMARYLENKPKCFPSS
jgi:hypothetical protein